MTAITWASERLVLLPERALWWARTRTLIVADVHLGKAAAYRSAGVPVPEATTTADLARLDGLLDAHDAARLIVLGDLLHAKAGRARVMLDAVRTWRASRPDLEILLVRGNHDRGAGDPPRSWRVRCVDEPFDEPPFVFVHDPAEAPRGPSVGGHLHPTVVLRDIDRTRLRGRCFVFGPEHAVLPAFGSFTGGRAIRPAPDERVFIVGDDAVVEVTAPARSS